jgi:hypothetical protein
LVSVFVSRTKHSPQSSTCSRRTTTVWLCGHLVDISWQSLARLAGGDCARPTGEFVTKRTALPLSAKALQQLVTAPIPTIPAISNRTTEPYRQREDVRNTFLFGPLPRYTRFPGTFLFIFTSIQCISTKLITQPPQLQGSLSAYITR